MRDSVFVPPDEVSSMKMWDFWDASVTSRE
jgi:hypothetical protein